MEITALIVLCIIAALLALSLRGQRPEFAMLLSLGCGLFVLLYLLGQMKDIFSGLEDILSGLSGQSELPVLPRCRRNSDCCQGGAGRQSSISDDEHASICFAAGNGRGAAAPMKYIIRILLALIFCRCVVLFPVQAQVIDPAAEVEQYFAGEDMTAVKDAIPPEVAEQMEQQGISSFSKLISMPVEQVWKILTDAFKEHLGAPLRVLLSLVGAVLLCSLVKGIGSSLGSGVHQVFSIIMTVFVISLLIRPVIECILSLHTVFADFSLFLTVYIPVFAGIMTTAGQPMTGALYNVLLFGACQGISSLLQAAFVPVISCYLSLAIVTEVVPQMGLAGIVSGFKKLITWALGLTMTLFVGLLSLQSAIAGGGDNVAVKTTKFMISSLIPGVGGSLSELFMATQGCVQLVKSTVGAAGIAIAVLTFLPVLLRVTLWQLVTAAGGIVGEMLGAGELSRLLKSVGSALSVMLAITLYYAMLFIVSTSLMILAFKGG